ncbi:PTS sugar transporter subunit IIA [Spirochaeta cellobiosiphila]|uniref:PTS sugar transporter subunit IIA n=1 Tax=Spirochaeta cellobiosiphila TaxID=504483 RepID=UPI00041BDBC9|nr:PTS sugar transporter subunit IIA [Spirochaeta cellobiosiphila]
MNIIDALDRNCIRIDAKPSTKEDVLRAITYLAKRSPLLEEMSEVEILERLTDREVLSSTGFLKGVAIPHCRIPGLKQFLLGLLMVPDGVPFDSFDGESSRYFFFILAPEEERDVHVQILSSLSLTFKQEENLKLLDLCKNKRELYEKVVELFGQTTLVSKGPSCLFNIILQVDNIRSELIRLLSQISGGQVAVINDTLIQAVVNKNLVNETIRRIDLLKKQNAVEKGLLVTVQDLIYQTGGLYF